MMKWPAFLSWIVTGSNPMYLGGQHGLGSPENGDTYNWICLLWGCDSYFWAECPAEELAWVLVWPRGPLRLLGAGLYT